MSRFFRSADSSSSSETDESDLDSDGEAADRVARPDQHIPARSGLSPGNPTENDVLVQPASGVRHQDILLHALLEERCLNQILDARRNPRSGSRPRRDDPSVQAEARAMYLRLCSQLAPYDFIPTGLEHEQHASTRQQYRDGLDLLGQQRPTPAFPSSLRRLISDAHANITPHSQLNGIAMSATGVDRSLNQPTLPWSLRRLLTGTGVGHQPDNSTALTAGQGVTGFEVHPWGQLHSTFESRYRRDFDELRTLGRGGYGIVYHVRHKLDNQFYAIKKVALSASRLQRLQARGQVELDELLREVRTLARLDHPNVVRYFGGWIEWVEPPTSSREIRSESNANRSTSASSGANLGAAESIVEFAQETITANDADGAGVVFEESGPMSEFEDGEVMATNELSSHNFSSLRRIRTRSTLTTVSDETIESIARDGESSISIQSAPNGAYFTEPTLALHLQMSLHPTTLADFLLPMATGVAGTEIVVPLRHCFHVEPSINIVLAILNGLEYLHCEGVIHRDIKPANIFLGAHSHPRSTGGSVDLMLCNSCRAAGTANAIRLDVRIGDFGLVAVTDARGDSHLTPKAVGTELYKPLAAGTVHHNLDVYALGIIAFELLWSFGTRTERYETINRLKQGEFPSDFEEKVGRNGAKLQSCIGTMLSHNGARISISELKTQLSSMAIL